MSLQNTDFIALTFLEGLKDVFHEKHGVKHGLQLPGGVQTKSDSCFPVSNSQCLQWSLQGSSKLHIIHFSFLRNPFLEPSSGHPALQTHEHSPLPHTASKLICAASRAPALKSHRYPCSQTLRLVRMGGSVENWGHSTERESTCQQEGEFGGQVCPQL